MSSIADGTAANEGAARAHGLRSYRTPAKIFHWATAGLVFLMVAIGVVMKQLSEGETAEALLLVHKSLGALTLTLVVLRVLYRMSGREQVPPGARRPTVHWLLYLLLIAIPLFGWAGASDFGMRELLLGYHLPQIWPRDSGFGDLLLSLHAWLAFGMLALVALHIGNALQDYMMRGRHDGPET